jgi:hypothetical protein
MMTAIWDSAGRFIQKITEDRKASVQESNLNERVRELWVFFQMLRDVVYKKKEYERMPIEYWWRKETWRGALKRLSDSPCSKDEDFEVANELVQLFHFFDHLNLPYRGKTTMGHFTETAIHSLRPDKDERRVLDTLYRN